MNPSIVIKSGGFELLPELETLWYDLKDQQATYAGDFLDMSTPTFDLRKHDLKEKSQHLLVEIAMDRDLGRKIGYCLSTIDQTGIGELESLFVEQSSRGQGIGTELTTRAIRWMNRHQAKAQRVSVFSANESALAFYKRLGFKSRVEELMIPRENTGAPGN